MAKSKTSKKNAVESAPDVNKASYELALAKSIVDLMAEDFNTMDHAVLPAGADYSNVLFSVSDHIRRAKAIIDGEGEEKELSN
jgi:hypothetical protein